MTGGHGAEARPRFTDNCEACGAALKEGAARCPFCGVRVAPEPPPPRPARPPRTGAAIGAIAAVGLAVVAAVSVARHLDERAAPPPEAPPPALQAKRLAGAACEERIRREVRSPFRVIAFRSSLVAEETDGGHVVTGTVDLQSLAGDLERRRYRCRVTRGAAGPVVEDGRLE